MRETNHLSQQIIFSGCRPSLSDVRQFFYFTVPNLLFSIAWKYIVIIIYDRWVI